MDFVEPYAKEFSAVHNRRLRELSPDEAARVRSEELLPKLRMLLSIKRDGRHKCRLILQGFSEPLSWDEGNSVDSPVAFQTTIRTPLAKCGPRDVVTS